MRLFIDVDSRQFVRSATYSQPITTLTVKRGDVMTVEVQFVQAGKVVSAGTSATGKLGIKTAYGSATYLAQAASWTASGTGENSLYTFNLDLTGAAIETAFTSNPDAVAILIECEWTVSTVVTSTLTLSGYIQNSVIRPS